MLPKDQVDHRATLKWAAITYMRVMEKLSPTGKIRNSVATLFSTAQTERGNELEKTLFTDGAKPFDILGLSPQLVIT